MEFETRYHRNAGIMCAIGNLSRICVASFVLSGCVLPIGDASMSVRGMIENMPEEAYGTCVLRLHDETGEALPHQIDSVTSDIDTGFVVPPSSREYILSIQCKGAPEIYQSDVIEFRPPRQTIDLGVIRF